MPPARIERALSRLSDASLCRWSTEAALSVTTHSPPRTRTWIARLSAVCSTLELKDRIESGGRIRTAAVMVMSHLPCHWATPQ